MENVTIKDIVEFTGGKPSQDLNLLQKVSRISNDSRTVDKDWIYLALKGERLDGHQFIAGAQDNGAVASIVEKPSKQSITVDNSYQALKQIALHYKNRFDIPYVAVTGSSGKTTTKDMIFYAVNETQKTLRNIGNLNSEIGLPMTILNLDSTYQCGILEMGMYDLGEIDYLAEIVKPNIGVITNVGTAHILNLKTRENILKAKLEIANYMTEKDILLINGDNDQLATVDKNALKPKVLTFGLKEHNDFFVKEYHYENAHTHIQALLLGEEIMFDIPTIGEHNVFNALSAMSVCKLLNLDMQASALGLCKYQPSKYRMEKIELEDKLVINDSYNANPDSMRASIATLNLIPATRKVAILGDMLELGEKSGQYHFEIGEYATEYVDIIIAIGQEAIHIIEGAKNKGMKSEQLYYFEDVQSAKAHINNILQKQDVVIVKGSRGMKLEEVAEFIC